VRVVSKSLLGTLLREGGPSAPAFKPAADESSIIPPVSSGWARLLKRRSGVDTLLCFRESWMRIICFISESRVIDHILGYPASEHCKARDPLISCPGRNLSLISPAILPPDISISIVHGCPYK
jgi:hypothetical protein